MRIKIKSIFLYLTDKQCLDRQELFVLESTISFTLAVDKTRIIKNKNKGSDEIVLLLLNSLFIIIEDYHVTCQEVPYAHTKKYMFINVV